MKRLVLVIAACGAAPPPPAPKSLQLNAPGAPVDVAAAVPAGYVSLVDYRADWCGACTTMTAMLVANIADAPRVVLREVDVTGAEAAFGISALPHVDIYDRQRRLRYVLVGNDCLRAPALARRLLAEP